MQELGSLIRCQRQALGLTLSDVAQSAGLTRSYLSMIENHRVDNPPSAKILEQLEQTLGLPENDLQRAAQWQRTPAAIRDRLAQAEQRAQRGEQLAHWLRNATHKRSDTGKDLDALYRSGQLSRRLRSVLDQTPDNTQRPADPPPAVDSHGRRNPPDTKQFASVPLVNKVTAGYPAEFTDLDYPPRVGDELIVVPGYTGLHGGDDPDAFAATVCGDSMQPAYQEGDVVVFAPLADVVDGCDCFVRLEPDHETTFKRVFLDEATGRIRLQPLNPDYPARVVDREHVAGLFRAVWRMSRL